MAKDRYPYPPDEFDVADRSNKPVGAHELPRSTWSKVWPFLLVLIIVPAVAFGAIKFISDRNSVPSGQVGTDDDGSDTNASNAPTAPTAPAPSPTDLMTPSVTPTQEVDKTTQVAVLNASGVGRQAAKGKAKLTDDGWQNVTAADYTGQNKTGDNAVYYAKKSQEASAQAVADTLGITQVERDDTESPDGITAVIRKALTD